jgi:hypothetical protein
LIGGGVGSSSTAAASVLVVPSVMSVEEEATLRSPAPLWSDAWKSSLEEGMAGRGKRERCCAPVVSTSMLVSSVELEPSMGWSADLGATAPKVATSDEALGGARWVVASLFVRLIRFSTRALCKSSLRTTKKLLQAV